MEQLFVPATQLGGTVFTVVAFLRYLTTRDTKWEKALVSNAKSNLGLARSLQKLTDKIGVNTTVVNKNISTTKKNTDVIGKNTTEVKRKNGYH